MFGGQTFIAPPAFPPFLTIVHNPNNNIRTVKNTPNWVVLNAVLGACWGTEELGWNERSREEITRREITIKWI